VAPDQDEVDWLFYTAIAHVAAGDSALAERTLESAIGRLPSTRRPSLLAAAGAAFFDYGADAIAARLLQRSLQLNYEPQVAMTAAWILATSREAAVRDGVAALMLAEPLAQAAPADPSAWSALAAAHAELGRFPQAVAAAERALAAARAAGDAGSLDLLQRRLATYRAGQPWRQ
jgi:predicted Zn-dependent protease